MNDGERLAFEHAAKLVKEYRKELKIFRYIATFETIVIFVLYFLLVWRC